MSGYPYVRRIDKPWGFELHLAPDDLPYMVKILHIDAGARLSLQRHLPGLTSPSKLETWVLHSGRAKVVWEGADGRLVETELEPGKGYTARTGAPHRLVGITDCEILEASTPEGDGTTERLEDDYARPDETVDMRREPGRGWLGQDNRFLTRRLRPGYKRLMGTLTGGTDSVTSVSEDRDGR
jgi:mannose-6-phosphate isomerase-like protein (cupin superfamily)